METQATNLARTKTKRGCLTLFECLATETFGLTMLIWKLTAGAINFGGKKAKENLDLVYVLHSLVLGNHFETNQHCFLARLRGELKMAPIRSFSVVKELVKSEEKTKRPEYLYSVKHVPRADTIKLCIFNSY